MLQLMAALNMLMRGEDADDAEAAAAQSGGQEAGKKPAVALIMACGQIVSGKGSATDLQPMREIASTPMCAQLRAARFDPQVKAIVLRIDTPGASAPHRSPPTLLQKSSLHVTSAFTALHCFLALNRSLVHHSLHGALVITCYLVHGAAGQQYACTQAAQQLPRTQYTGRSCA